MSRMWGDRRGVTTVEYAMLAALMAVLAGMGMQALGATAMSQRVQAGLGTALVVQMDRTPGDGG